MRLRYPLHRRFPISSTFDDHKARTPPSTMPGTDFAAPGGEPVFAVLGGYVEVAEGKGAGGIRVWLNHGKDEHERIVKSYYAHMRCLEVVKGQRVNTGEKIGEVGSTGNSTGPHLHLTISVDHTPIDPMSVLE